MFKKLNNKLKASLLDDLLGSLSKDVFEQRTSTGSDAFSLFTWFDANKFVLLSVFSLIKTEIYPRFLNQPLPNDTKNPLPADVRRSKTLLLKLPIYVNRPFALVEHVINFW